MQESALSLKGLFRLGLESLSRSLSFCSFGGLLGANRMNINFMCLRICVCVCACMRVQNSEGANLILRHYPEPQAFVIFE